MAILSGLLYSVPYEKDIKELPHSRHYYAQAKNPVDRTIWGYEVVKLEADVIYYVGWRADDMKEYHAEKGEYLVQTMFQPPRIIETWSELRAKYKVFQNRKENE